MTKEEKRLRAILRGLQLLALCCQENDIKTHKIMNTKPLTWKKINRATKLDDQNRAAKLAIYDALRAVKL